MRIKIVVEYDGREFSGWQVQPRKRTVEGELEGAIYAITGESAKLFVSGRTDAGVHALAQVAHFDLKQDFYVERLPFALNTVLPKDVRVLKAESVASDFNARFDVKVKTYEYRCYRRKISSPLREGRSAQIEFGVDVEAMRKASELFLGSHNFVAFCKTNTSVKDFRRTIFALDIAEEGEELIFTISGNGFLYNMVRMIVGTLIDVGRGKLEPRLVKRALSRGDKKGVGKTMPACGLYLKNVEY